VNETRYSLQRRFGGERQTPHTASWVAQRIHEEKEESSIGILLAWTHLRRYQEVTPDTIDLLNSLPDTEAVEALKELKQPKKYVQGIGGNKLSTKVVVKTHNELVDTITLIDSGCTGSCVHSRFVKKYKIPTRKLPRPIPVYNADGTLNKHGAITETITIELTIQDHLEIIELAVSDLGSSDIFLGHEWLKNHNPNIDWRKSLLFFNRCSSKCRFHQYNMEIDTDHEAQASTDKQTDEQSNISYEDEDRLFVFDVDSYLESDSFNINRTNYDYVKNYNPEIGKTQKWIEVVPETYHDYEDVFTKKEFDKLPERRPWDHAIELTPGFKPVDCKTYPLSKAEQEKLQEFIEENLRTGRIVSSKSPMASPFFFVKKKDGALRPTQDYRKLNEATIKNRYPLPLVSKLIDRFHTSKIFTKMDVRWGYNNIRIKEGDEWKAAFRTNMGLFEPTVMFFGLMNSPATFQNFMNHIFRDLIAKGVVEVYMGDILVHTITIEEHRQVTREVLRILRENNLFLKPEKCVFHQTEVEYLGMIVGNGTVRMDPAKIQAIRDWPIPKTKRELQRFLGFCNYYRRFIKNYSKHAKPLTILTGNTNYTWSTDQQTAFETLINAVTSEPTLTMPDEKGQFRIEADSSDYAIGAILSQHQDDKWHPIAYLSKALTETQRNYEIYDKEMLAIMLSLEEWRHYLIGADEVFEIWTDHQNLQYFRQPQKVNRRFTLWPPHLGES